MPSGTITASLVYDSPNVSSPRQLRVRVHSTERNDIFRTVGNNTLQGVSFFTSQAVVPRSIGSIPSYPAGATWKTIPDGVGSTALAESLVVRVDQGGSGAYLEFNIPEQLSQHIDLTGPNSTLGNNKIVTYMSIRNQYFNNDSSQNVIDTLFESEFGEVQVDWGSSDLQYSIAGNNVTFTWDVDNTDIFGTTTSGLNEVPLFVSENGSLHFVEIQYRVGSNWENSPSQNPTDIITPDSTGSPQSPIIWTVPEVSRGQNLQFRYRTSIRSGGTPISWRDTNARIYEGPWHYSASENIGDIPSPLLTNAIVNPTAGGPFNQTTNFQLRSTNTRFASLSSTVLGYIYSPSKGEAVPANNQNFHSFSLPSGSGTVQTDVNLSSLEAGEYRYFQRNLVNGSYSNPTSEITFYYNKPPTSVNYTPRTNAIDFSFVVPNDVANILQSDLHSVELFRGNTQNPSPTVPTASATTLRANLTFTPGATTNTVTGTFSTGNIPTGSGWFSIRLVIDSTISQEKGNSVNFDSNFSTPINLSVQSDREIVLNPIEFPATVGEGAVLKFSWQDITPVIPDATGYTLRIYVGTGSTPVYTETLGKNDTNFDWTGSLPNTEYRATVQSTGTIQSDVSNIEIIRTPPTLQAPNVNVQYFGKAGPNYIYTIHVDNPFLTFVDKPPGLIVAEVENDGGALPDITFDINESNYNEPVQILGVVLSAQDERVKIPNVRIVHGWSTSPNTSLPQFDGSEWLYSQLSQLTSITLFKNSEEEVSITWNNAAFYAGFIHVELIKDGSSVQATDSTAIGSSNLIFSGLPAGQYIARGIVNWRDQFNGTIPESDPVDSNSATLAGTVQLPPDDPSLVTVLSNTDNVFNMKVDFASPTTADAIRYRFYESTTLLYEVIRGNINPGDTTITENVTVPAQHCGKNMTITAAGYNGQFSNETTASGTHTFNCPSSAEDLPTEVNANAVSFDNILVSWTPPVSGRTRLGYTIQVADPNVNSWTTISSSIAPTATNYTWTGGQPNEEYIFRIRANYSDIITDYVRSNTVSTGFAVQTPQPLIAHQSSLTQVNVSWPNVPDSVSFQLKRRFIINGTPGNLVSIFSGTNQSGSTSSYIDAGLNLGDVVQYSVIVLNSQNETSAEVFSNTVTIEQLESRIIPGYIRIG